MKGPPFRSADKPWRLSATMLLGILSAFLALPVLAAARQGTDASLPACCRAHGKHHCLAARNTSLQESGKPAFRQPATTCPYAPTAPVSVGGKIFHPGWPGFRYAELALRLRSRPHVETGRRTPFDRSQQKRGPPTRSLPA